MNPNSSLSHSILPELYGSSHNGYGGTIIPEYIMTQQLSSNNVRKKSKVRLNDQLVPKPADINIMEKMAKIPTPKENPYSSHTSRFAMFPSFHEPDSRHTKAVAGKNQAFNPTPPKTALPNPKLCGRDFSISEKTRSMLKILERTNWVTSYQMHYTGFGPANPLKIDDLEEKIADQTKMNSHIAQKERSYPMFAPPKPKQGYTRRQTSCVWRNCSPTDAEHHLSSSPEQSIATASGNQHRPQENSAKHNEADLNPKSHSQTKTASPTEAQSAGLSQEVSHQQQTEHKRSEQDSVSQSRKDANGAGLVHTEQLADLHNHPHSQGEKSLIELCDEQKVKVGRNSHTRASSEQEKLAEVRVHNISNPSILSSPPGLCGIRHAYKAGTMSRETAALSLLQLQNSFSKSEAHRRFNSSTTHSAANLRDNVVTGKKHNFYGINSCHLHG